MHVHGSQRVKLNVVAKLRIYMCAYTRKNTCTHTHSVSEAHRCDKITIRNEERAKGWFISLVWQCITGLTHLQCTQVWQCKVFFFFLIMLLRTTSALKLMSFLFLVYSINILNPSWLHGMKTMENQVMDVGQLPYMKIMGLFVTRNEMQWTYVSLPFF